MQLISDAEQDHKVHKRDGLGGDREERIDDEKAGGKVDGVGEGGEGGEGEVGAVLVEYESGEVVRSEMVQSRREREEIVERFSRLLCVDKEEVSTPRGKTGGRPDYLKNFYRK